MPNDKSPPKPETAAQQETGGDCPSASCCGSSDWPDDDACCRSCGCTQDLVHDDDGELVCCDCLFEEETYDINQP